MEEQSESMDVCNGSEDASYFYMMRSLMDCSPARLPERCGWLLKRTNNPFKKWQRRYFVLQSKKLRYYHKESDSKPAGSFNFDLTTLTLQLIRQSKDTELVLQPLCSKRKFRLKAEDYRELEAWAVSINEHICASQGRLGNVMSVSRTAKFWRWDRITNKHFTTLAATGDILLFSGRDWAAKAQRFVTRSKYDHVALLLRYSSDQLAILEATSLEGVRVLLWTDFLKFKWHLLYSRLVYRPLEYERSGKMLRELEVFIREVRGMQFQLSAAKLMGKSSDSETQKGYFCSELLATAFKRCGLLRPEAVASKYWPGHFSTEKRLELQSAELGEELQIDFEPSSLV